MQSQFHRRLTSPDHDGSKKQHNLLRILSFYSQVNEVFLNKNIKLLIISFISLRRVTLEVTLEAAEIETIILEASQLAI